MSDSRHDPADIFRAAQDHARAEAAPPPGLPGLAELQQHFPEFELHGLIGRGGMGAVYKAHDPKLGRDLAIKILPPHLVQDPAFAERFVREARTLAKLQHPHVLTVFDYGEREGLHYLLTEFVDGLDLRRLMLAERLDPSEALRIVPQICDALQFAHEHGVVHRDIKPENVLIDTRGHVKVADFGLAKLLGESGTGPSLTATSQTVGTPHYVAPEALRGQPVDHRADIFGLGVLLYEMLTGQLPVGQFQPPSARAGTDRRLDAVVSRALQDEPEQRYQRVSEVRSDLANPAAARPAEPARSAARPDASSPKRRTSPWRVIGYILLTLFGVFVVGGLAMALLLRPTSVVTVESTGAASTPSGDPSSPAMMQFSIIWLGASAVLIFLFWFLRSGFRGIDRVRRSGEPAGAGGAVFRAWFLILIGFDLVVFGVLPQLDDRDANVLLQIAIGAALFILNIGWLIWQTSVLRADALRGSVARKP